MATPEVPQQPNYTYHATIVKIVDADTLDVDIDYGDRLHAIRRLRVQHIDAYEHTTSNGKLAAAWVRGLLPPGTSVVVTTTKPDKYGRQLATVMLPNDIDLATALLQKGYAVPYEGGTKTL